MTLPRSPIGQGKGIDHTQNPPNQETGKNISLNDLSTNDLKEILKGEGLSDKGKVKADYVQRLEKYAVEKGDGSYQFIIDRYPHLVKSTLPHQCKLMKMMGTTNPKTKNNL